uniref:TSA: Wollemia nobilis Ref_Wollemi_Transcript_7137_1365 transcribed RNA sequence n=1 Tax=Wollemia nobilis TaxID=56998 RepID=A0A0C9QV91_9CONI
MQSAIGRSDILNVSWIKSHLASSEGFMEPCNSGRFSLRCNSVGTDAISGNFRSPLKRLSLKWRNTCGRSVKIKAEADDSGRAASGTPPEQAEAEAKAKARSTFLWRSQTHTLLKRQMRVAVLNEDYKEAARLRDAMKVLEEEEPALRLQSSLKRAISEEMFEDAAKYRNELELIAPDALLKCFSDTTTLGIRVQVRSTYVKGRSQPSKGQYFFAYRIRISNLSDRPVQLLRRHWAITDATGKTEHIWGIGVIGEQPVVLPGTSFEYSSACPLGSSTGKMEGEFEMKYVDKVNSDTFNVVIGAFALSVDGDEDSV